MNKVSFCGISGSGMSALAQVLKCQGVEVCGSDRSFDQGKDGANKQALKAVGIKIFPQDGSAVDEQTDCLYVSTAVEETIPDVQKALKLNVPIKKRSDLLAEIFNRCNNGIAIGGTSGKTTVTAMTGYILDQLGYKPLVINGGLFKNYADQPGIANVILHRSDICVVEADESDGSIEKYDPYIAVVNNITIDHKSIEELQALFAAFVKKAKGGAVINLDSPNMSGFLNLNPKTITFSLKNPAADVCLSAVRPIADGVAYCLKGQTFRLKIPGAFNAANAAAAIAACAGLGVDPIAAAAVLEGFLGTKRRLDVIGCRNEITVIDDFAHNPDKVLASMSALRDYPGRLLVMFQPHGFSPMRLMGKQIMESFAATMKQDDRLFLPEIYYSGGAVKRDISSQDLVNYAQKLGVHAEFFQNREEIKQKLIAQAKGGDRIVIMGARDNLLPDFCKEILEGIGQNA